MSRPFQTLERTGAPPTPALPTSSRQKYARAICTRIRACARDDVAMVSRNAERDEFLAILRRRDRPGHLAHITCRLVAHYARDVLLFKIGAPMLKPFSPGNGKLPDFLTLPEEPESFPAPLRRAVRLMRAGAAVTTVWGLYVAIYSVFTTSYTVSAKGQITAVTGPRHVMAVVLMVVFTLIFATAWTQMARMTQQGRNAARVTSMVLFFFWSVMSFLSIGSVSVNIGLAVEVVGILIIWAIGLGAIFLLWRPESSEHFRK